MSDTVAAALLGGIAGAMISGAVAIGSLLMSSRSARADRQRQLFGDAFEAIARYREYPFIVRRRRGGEPEEERQRISDQLSELQARLNSFQARIAVECAIVGDTYRGLLAATRRIVGPRIRDAWNEPPLRSDMEIHAPTLDFSRLETFDGEFLAAVRDHLGWLPHWVGDLRRRVRL